jgi:hypothetical protein
MSPPNYRQRKRSGQIRAKPRRLTAAKAKEIRRRYFAREAIQMTLALEFSVSQATISRVISGQVWP